MKPNDDANRITRRTFLEQSTGALASSAIPVTEGRAEKRKEGDSESGAAAKQGKIALEDQFVIPETLGASYGAAGSADFQFQFTDIAERRIAEMDRGGVEICILSLVGQGIQAIPSITQAIETARKANDHLAESAAKNPKRIKGFAALPMQDPRAAAKELTRCIRELKFCGALVNGFSQVNQPDSVVFYDEPAYREFWATVQELDVPFYLHPRSPLPKKQAV